MHEVWRENGACSRRTSQAGLHLRRGCWSSGAVRPPQFRATATSAFQAKVGVGKPLSPIHLTFDP
jgi:hypothetical protein